jgi:dihydroflavonol-4-reductase
VQVLITGGTGFVGSHTVNAVAHAGHDVRLLVRSEKRVAPALDPLEVDPPPLVVGDATHPGAVREALDGCDAVIHCAAVFSYHPRHAADMATTNFDAAELVLRSALEEGCDPVVNCSSIVALLPRNGGANCHLKAGHYRHPLTTRIKPAAKARPYNKQNHGQSRSHTL